MNRRERRVSAGKSGKALSDRAAATPASLYKTGLRHLQAGRDLDVQACCQQALALDPDHSDSLHLMGLLCLRAKQHDHAAEWLIRAIRRDPRPEYLSSLGSALQQQGRYDDALKTVDKAVQLKPDDPRLWQQLGHMLADMKRPAEAVLALQHVLKLDPKSWDAANQCGILLHDLGRLAEALACFSLCDRLRPDQAQTLYHRGQALSGLRRYPEALADLERGCALDPGHAEIRNSLGFVLRALGRHREALEAFDRALRLRADHVEALNGKAMSLAYFNRFEEALALMEQIRTLQPAYVPAQVNKALWLSELHRFDEALAAYGQANVLDPGNADAAWNSSFLHLLLGNFEAGWAGHEARWKAQARSNTSYPDFSEPRWTGQEPVEGKTVLIYAEEGLGDAIQFARYIPMVAARGADIVLVVGAPVRSLLSGLPGVSQCLTKPLATRPAFDFHCAISSLPLIFGTRLDTIPDGTSFLPPPPADLVQAWEDRLGRHDRPRVGLVWSGHPRHKNDHNRSIPLDRLHAILGRDATFVSLQKEPRPEDKTTLLERREIVDLTEHLGDFVDTAALVSCLDLVITVDTSVAHLAATLGRPTWILLPYTPDFRWLLDRDDSPWYPSVRLFRQNEDRDYGAVLDRVRAALDTRIAAWPR